MVTADEAVRLSETLAAHLTPLQATVCILLLPTIMGAFGAIYLFRRRLGIGPDEATGAKDITERTKTLIDSLQGELTRWQHLSAQYMAELGQLQAARISVWVRAQQFRDAAIAARTMMHELERRMGLPETDFPPLPDLPVPAPTGVSAPP